MSEIVGGWCSAAVAFAAFLLIVPVTIRAFGGERRLVEVCVGTAFAVFALWLWARPPSAAAFWSFAALYGFLFVAFLQAFAVIFKSISLRMLVEIDRLPGKTLSVDRAHEALIRQGAYARRLVGLEKGGLISQEGPTIRLTEKGRRTAEWLLAFQRLFGIRQSG
jgi:hypothetical protein